MKKSNLKSVSIDALICEQSRLTGTNTTRVEQLIPSIYRDGILEPLKGYFNPNSDTVTITQGNHRIAAIKALKDGVKVGGYFYKKNISTVLVDIIDECKTSIVTEYQSNNTLNWGVLDTVSAVFDIIAKREPLLLAASDEYKLKNVVKQVKDKVEIKLLPYVGESSTLQVYINETRLTKNQFKLFSNENDSLLELATATAITALEKDKDAILKIVSYVPSMKAKVSVNDALVALGAPFTAPNFTQISKPYITLTNNNTVSISEIMEAQDIKAVNLPSQPRHKIEKITMSAEMPTLERDASKCFLLALEHNTVTKSNFFKLLKLGGYELLRQYIVLVEKGDVETANGLLKNDAASKSQQIRERFLQLMDIADENATPDFVEALKDFAIFAGILK